MDIISLRKKLSEIPRYEHTVLLKNAPVIHRGFPSCFNLSFAEYEMLENYNGYIKYDHDLIFSKIQPCIRHQDWKTIVDDNNERFRYLSVFDMADISGMIVKQGNTDQEKAAKFVIKSFIDFIKNAGLDIKNLRVSYFSGDTIINATKGKYNIEKIIEADPLKSYWTELGLKENQLIPDNTRKTLLSLRIYGLPTPWGYRNEINYISNDKEIDIGTVEYMRFQPIISDNDEIVDIEPFEDTVAVSAIGVERLVMVLNNFKNIWEIDTVQPLIKKVESIALIKDPINIMILVQALRAIHRIVCDGGTYSSLNRKRGKILRGFYRELSETFGGNSRAARGAQASTRRPRSAAQVRRRG